jgi:hypothetical protein
MNLTTSRRADEFHRLLESPVRGDDPVTGPLLAVADALQVVPDVPSPRPEFRAALRQRLVAVATVQGAGAPVETPLQRARSAGATWKFQRRLSAIAAGAAVVTGVAGVGVGASRSLPGQPFYGVKRAAEGAQLATTLGTEARGKRHLEFARTRLSEVQALAGTSGSLAPMVGAHAFAGALADSGRTKLIEDTLHAMDVETRSGANDLFASYRSSGSGEPLRALDRFTRRQYQTLHTLMPSLPESARAAANGSLALLAVVATDTVKLYGAGTTPTTPGTGTPTPGKGSGRPTPGGTHTPSGTSSSTPTVQPPSSTSPSTPTGPSGGLPSVGPVNPPVVPSIPPLPTGSTLPVPLPSELPTLPDVTGLLGH